MNVLVKTIGGGIFSKFIVAIQSIVHDRRIDVDLIDNIYVEIDPTRLDVTTQPNPIENETGNPFNFVLDQVMLTPDVVVLARPYAGYTPNHIILGGEEIRKLRVVCGKIKLKDTVLSKVHKDIDSTTLAVHVRLTDMKQHHPELHRGSTTNDYINVIDGLNPNGKIFVSSDNETSLKTLVDKYGAIHNTVTNRWVDESTVYSNGDYYGKYMAEQMHTESFWVDSFVDMISISKCGGLVYKPSNLNNTAMLYSDTISKIYGV
jgi:hypothetical protein